MTRASEGIGGRHEAHEAVAEPGTRGGSSAGVPAGYVEQRTDEPARRRQASCAAAGRPIRSRGLIRRVAAAAALAIALPALAYLLPVSAILRRVAEKRASLQLASLEVTGTFQAEGAAAERLAPATGVEARAGQLTLPARLSIKVPGRCRLELAPPEATEGERPYVAVHDARTSGARGLNGIPAAVALVRATCALLAVSPAGGGEAYAAALAKRGVALADDTLGRFDGRIAYVIGGREKSDRPLAYVDKDAFQPMRLVSAEGGVVYDVRLLGWGSPTGGDWFPRAVEVWEKDQLRLRFTTEKPTPNPRMADALFP